MSNMAYCPECDSRIRLQKKARVGQHISCHECEETLEVVNLNPLELTWAFDDLVSNKYDDYETGGDDYDEYDYSLNGSNW